MQRHSDVAGEVDARASSTVEVGGDEAVRHRQLALVEGERCRQRLGRLGGGLGGAGAGALEVPVTAMSDEAKPVPAGVHDTPEMV